MIQSRINMLLRQLRETFYTICDNLVHVLKSDWRNIRSLPWHVDYYPAPVRSQDSTPLIDDCTWHGKFRANWRCIMFDTPCIEWAGRKNKAGYGVFSKGRRNGRDITGLAHRHVWELKHGPLSRGLQILHRCDNPSCVNPDHLRVGDQLDNMHDMIAKGRQNWRGGKVVRTHPPCRRICGGLERDDIHHCQPIV